MWLFLITEILFFGGLFAGYALYRSHMPEGFQTASSHLNIFLGGFNTVVLIASSLTMAMAVRSCQLGDNPKTRNFLIATLFLGLVFLGVKVIEYGEKIEHHLVPGPNFDTSIPFAQGQQMFYNFYFAMTGMHALHMIIGSGLLIYFIVRAHQGRYHSNYFGPVEIMGLYWHFVDIVWIFLFPLLYLLGLHLGGH
ncbi:MAG: cytochrome c oxidase subunit 3 family protein [Acidobacteria bacterium]|nr:cytochrome c oxidase subunit 3 family protein [Acidobacteriota bacterium]